MTNIALRHSLLGTLAGCAVALSAYDEVAAAAGAAAAARAGAYAHSRTGMASHGGFASSLPARGIPSAADRGDRGALGAHAPQNRQQIQDLRQDAAGSTTKSVKIEGGGDCRSDCWDNGQAAARIAAAAAVSQAAAAANAQAVMPCNVAPVTVSGAPYYRCADSWYTPGYAGDGVVYMPVPAPAGQ
ncbi:MAG TPA: hypothetical protein VEX61_05310 [Burkholderiales bacterium]|nr:hypothetical protein [Burkholderiales bacterium]